MRYFIITSGPAEGERFAINDDQDIEDARKEAFILTVKAVYVEHTFKEITAEQYADEFEGEE